MLALNRSLPKCVLLSASRRCGRGRGRGRGSSQFAARSVHRVIRLLTANVITAGDGKDVFGEVSDQFVCLFGWLVFFWRFPSGSSAFLSQLYLQQLSITTRAKANYSYSNHVQASYPRCFLFEDELAESFEKKYPVPYIQQKVIFFKH